MDEPPPPRASSEDDSEEESDDEDPPPPPLPPVDLAEMQKERIAKLVGSVSAVPYRSTKSYTSQISREEEKEEDVGVPLPEEEEEEEEKEEVTMELIEEAESVAR